MEAHAVVLNMYCM